MSRRVAAALLAGVAASLLAAPALAQDDRQDELSAHHKTYESPQYFEMELRLGPFLPAVDSDPSLHGCTPFADIFGTSPSIMAGVEFDWQALRIPHLGSIGPALGLSYVQFSANAPTVGSSTTGGCVRSSGQTSGEQTSLTIYPAYLAAVFRLDFLWKDVGIPFVPYAKLGLGAALWQASNTLGTSNFGGALGRGYTIGSQLALGVGFNLNVLDPYAARGFDESMGVNGTYVFAEFADASLDGLFLQNDPLRVGGTSWTFGMAWEF